jgi:hypothetical protein
VALQKGSVALSLRTAARPLGTRLANVFGACVSETTITKTVQGICETWPNTLTENPY